MMLPESAAAALALAAMTVLTLARWERGIAPRGRAGAVLVVAGVFCARWWAFGSLPPHPVAAAAAAGALARAVYVTVAWVSRPAAEGANFAPGLDSLSAVAAIGASVMVVLTLPFRLAWAFCAASILMVFAARRFCQARGGATDAALGGAGLMTETVLWMVAACRSCMW
jgi:cobalamin synthase